MTPHLHLRLLTNRASDPPADLFADPQGRPLQRLPPGCVVRRMLAVPATEVALHRLPLQASTPAQAKAAARRLLADRFARREPVELAVGDDLGDGHRWVAVFAPHALMGWQRRAGDFQADAVVPDCLLLPTPASDEAVSACIEDDYWRVRTATSAFSAEASLARLVLGSRPEPDAETVTIARALLLAGAAAPVVLDLAGREPVRSAPAWSRAIAALLAAVVVLPPLGLAAIAFWHALAASRVEARTEEALVAVLPGATGPGTAAARANAALGRQHAYDRFPHLVAALLQAQQRVPGAHIGGLRFGADGVLAVDWRHAAPGDIDLLRTELERHGVHVSADPSAPSGSGWLTPLLLGDRR